MAENLTMKLEEDITLLDVQEVAALLRVKVQTIYSWLHFKQLPNEIYISLGSKKLFIKSRLEDWLWKGAELKKRPSKK